MDSKKFLSKNHNLKFYLDLNSKLVVVQIRMTIVYYDNLISFLKEYKNLEFHNLKKGRYFIVVESSLTFWFTVWNHASYIWNFQK